MMSPSFAELQQPMLLPLPSVHVNDPDYEPRALPTETKSEIEGDVKVWEKLRQEFVHAFALPPTASALAPEETALLDKIATLVVKRGMAVPAMLFLESVGPLNFLGSQVLHGLRPFLELVCSATEMERLATMLERRESVPHLIALIQQRADSPA